jgi:hypothetical protein
LQNTPRLGTINSNMNRKFELKKIEADKIVLLGLFAVSLLIAHIITSVKSVLILSEPIELTNTGLSVSIPLGNGWESKKEWEYQANSFILSSSFTENTDRPTAWAYCQYIINAETVPPKLWFEQKSAEVDGPIIDSGQTQADLLTVEWAHIEKPKLFFSLFLGTIELPYNRRLNIEVHEITGEVELAEQVFKQILKSITFEENKLFENSSEIVKEIKNKGLDSFIGNQNKQVCFLINDSSGQTIGFMIDAVRNSNSEAKFNIHAAGHFYGRGLREQASRFRCGNNLNEFIWESESTSMAGRINTEIILDESGIMTVRDTKTQLSLKHRLSPVAIPDIFIETLLNQIIDSNRKQIIVDMIDADGKITPTLISIVENKIASNENTAHVIKMEFLDGQGFFELIYLNDQRQFTKVVVQLNERYILKTTILADIVKEFPERADFLSQRSNMFKDNFF